MGHIRKLLEQNNPVSSIPQRASNGTTWLRLRMQILKVLILVETTFSF